MGKMILALDPMPQLRSAALDQIAAHFNGVGISEIHRDAAHRRKREVARAILSGTGSYPEFEEEARMRGVSMQDFAADIAGRPDPLDGRELKRQKALLAVEGAVSPANIVAALQEAGVSAGP